VLDSVSGALENMFHRIVRERFQPQFLDLAQLLCVREGGVVLVVVVQPEQGEYLVDCFDMRLCRLPAARFTLPMRCR